MMSTLTERLQNLGLFDSSFLAFNPTGEKAWIKANFDDVPPYLIRVFTPQSAGSTDECWVKSRDARYSNKLSAVDIFTRDNDHVANMLNIHLRWWGKSGDSDNVTSWTGSWLFALQYIFHLHKNIRDASSLDDIKICMIDTTLFPKGYFVRDMDLIRAYEQFNPGLRDLGRLRSKKHKHYGGSYYFGEYLSQGALRIERKCKIVPASAVVDNGLFTIQPLFREFENWEVTRTPPWANEVIRLREDFYGTESEIHQDEIQASIDIAKLFGPDFRLPMAAGLIGLLPRRADDASIQRVFRSTPFTEESMLSVREYPEF
ncbi:hypothetical protein B0J13DRAFT_200320 [Dactylonectria estremocensis]|uniref:DUF7587 domain-containing protein n=1 Tax=Dactylonectria estremocensis TaxID=1079267 RepID=A0A9P9I8G3_9HYPO|nr:hypothetical protein B0J13DRAFT_292280 [Dactylonectria estremocensis]KAH7118035.1 hypothetical protein B0J13DRAFT_200320 [Dactylonectria estremocensis]